MPVEGGAESGVISKPVGRECGVGGQLLFLDNESSAGLAGCSSSTPFTGVLGLVFSLVISGTELLFVCSPGETVGIASVLTVSSAEASGDEGRGTVMATAWVGERAVEWVDVRIVAC